MKGFLTKILKYVILAVVLFAGSVVLQTYLQDKTLGFNIEYLSSSYLNSKRMMKFERCKATVCISLKTNFIKIAISNYLQIIFDTYNLKEQMSKKIIFPS